MCRRACSLFVYDTGRTTTARGMSTHSVLTSGISNDAGKGQVDNNAVGPETEVVGRSTDNSATSSTGGKLSGSIGSGKIVDVVSSTQAAAQHPVNSDHFAASDMGNVVNKNEKLSRLRGETKMTAAVFEEPRNGVRQEPVREMEQTSECVSDSESAPPSSNAADELLTDFDKQTTDDDKLTSDVTLPGNPGITDAHNDVTTSEITREADTELELSTLPLTVSLEEAVTKDSVESHDVALNKVEGMSVSVSGNGQQLSGSSAEIRRETEATGNIEVDATRSDVCSQDDTDLERSSSQSSDFSASSNAV